MWSLPGNVKPAASSLKAPVSDASSWSSDIKSQPLSAQAARNAPHKPAPKALLNLETCASSIEQALEFQVIFYYSSTETETGVHRRLEGITFQTTNGTPSFEQPGFWHNVMTSMAPLGRQTGSDIQIATIWIEHSPGAEDEANLERYMAEQGITTAQCLPGCLACSTPATLPPGTGVDESPRRLYRVRSPVTRWQAVTNQGGASGGIMSCKLYKKRNWQKAYDSRYTWDTGRWLNLGICLRWNKELGRTEMYVGGD